MRHNNIGIIGFGRFGQLLADILKEDFSLMIFDPKPPAKNLSLKFVELAALAQCETIFVCVPIRAFADVIIQVAPLVKKDQTIVDVCSVKEYPVTIMQKHLPNDVNIIATHPLFGPDSFILQNELKIMMHSVRGTTTYTFWKNYFAKKKFKIIEMSPTEHDRLAAKTQGLTHFIGRTLEAMHAEPTALDTKGFQTLLTIMQQTCQDSFELFSDLQKYNRFTKEVMQTYIEKADKIFHAL